MGSHYEWTDVEHAYCTLVDRERAPDELNTWDVTAAWALFIGSGDGDGVIVEDDLDQIVAFVDHVHARVHAVARRAARTVEPPS
jgi:hypothetical protein